MADIEILRGTLDVILLRALANGPMHGYAVTSWIRARTGDAMTIEEGALYPALHRLQRNGWVESEWGYSENNRKARYYKLTATGRGRLREETRRWDAYAELVSRILRPV
ncbi:MAG TPA: PadR family transcriptional regulator [Gemmatimonadaceae bacterium]|jgi:transcriptional regulator|nr:PadR family transcriptional regulator [Gemmatimonadaceae bacterium]